MALRMRRATTYICPMSPRWSRFVAWESKVRDDRHRQRGMQPDTWRKNKGGPLSAQFSGLGHLLAQRGLGSRLGTLPTTATQTTTTLSSRSLDPWHCSSGLSLLQAKLALNTNPLNNFQLLSKSIGLLNHELMYHPPQVPVSWLVCSEIIYLSYK